MRLLLTILLASVLAPAQMLQSISNFRTTAAAAGISFIGQCTGTTSCTPPTHAVGDLFLVAVGRDATVTAPTLASGWTQVTAPSINGTSTADSVMLVACKVATSTSETVTGFTNGANLVAHVYRGAAAGSTSTCASSILGTPSNFTSTVNTTTTTVTYNSITNRDSASWDVGFAYAPAATAGLGTAPSGMTARSLAGSTKAAGNDTNAGVSSYSTANVTVTTAGRVITSTFEIKANEGMTLVQRAQNTACSGTTCAVTLTQTTAAGNLLVFMSMSQNAVTISSVNKGGTVVPVKGCIGYSNVNNQEFQCAYILPSNTSAATTPLTITFSAAVGTYGMATVYEFAPASNGSTVGFDNANVDMILSGTTPVSPGYTISGTNDLILVTCGTANNCTAFSSPFDTESVFASGTGFGDATNQSSGTTGSTATLSGAGETNMASIAFGFNTTACTDYTFLDFEGSANNTTMTQALINASGTDHGWDGGGQWTLVGTAPKFQSAASQGLLTSLGRNCSDGATYASGAGSIGMQVVRDAANPSAIALKFGRDSNGSGLTTLTSGVWYNSDLVAADASVHDVFIISSSSGAQFALVKMLGDVATRRFFHLETDAGTATGDITYTVSSWVWLSLQYQDGSNNYVLKVYDSTGSLLGTLTKAATITEQPYKVSIGVVDNTANFTAGKVMNFDSLKISLAGTYPLLP